MLAQSAFLPYSTVLLNVTYHPIMGRYLNVFRNVKATFVNGVQTIQLQIPGEASIVLASPALVSTTAYLAVTSIAVIGLYIAYVTPVFLRRMNPDFKPGRWNLGRWSAPIGWIAVAWVIFIVILFMLPPASPISIDTFNYAPVAVLLVVVFATVSWFLAGRKHFMVDVPEGHDTIPPAEIFR